MEVTVQVPAGHAGLQQVGSNERHLKMIREALGVSITAREGRIQISGTDEPVAVARQVLSRLAQAPELPSRQAVLEMITDESDRIRRARAGVRSIGPIAERLEVFSAGRAVRAKTPNQRQYLDAIGTHDLTFGIGPAGTGKTYLAVAAAIHLLRQDAINRLVLVRPAVEAGERLGFLPGGLEEKVDPYLRPLLDALHDMMEVQSIRRFVESGVVEVAPLAFMRGRTLNHAAVILDEAQNTTRGQMKMFLTRMGQGSKVIVTGDVTQIDLPDPRESGLIDAARRLRNVPGVAFCQLTGQDVVRHPLVQRVIEAYGDDEEDGKAKVLQRELRSALAEDEAHDHAGGQPPMNGNGEG